MWNQVHACVTKCLHFSQLTLQATIFGFHNIDNDPFLIQNHIPFLFKLHIYNTKKYGYLSFNSFLNNLSKIKNLERTVASCK